MDQIRGQCVSGALAAGDRLPSVRQLAGELAVNPNTILRVYERLTAEGLLEMRHGDGTYVTGSASVSQVKLETAAVANELDLLVRRARGLGLDDAEIQALLRQALERTRREATADATRSKS
jgi:GntR family transcriptional regulator